MTHHRSIAGLVGLLLATSLVASAQITKATVTGDILANNLGYATDGSVQYTETITTLPGGFNSGNPTPPNTIYQTTTMITVGPKTIYQSGVGDGDFLTFLNSTSVGTNFEFQFVADPTFFGNTGPSKLVYTPGNAPLDDFFSPVSTFGLIFYLVGQPPTVDYVLNNGNTFTLAATNLSLDGSINDDPSLLNLPVPTSAVPEPSTYGLIGAASLLGLVAYRRRLQK